MRTVHQDFSALHAVEKGGGRADVCVLEYVPNAVEAEA
jgi:hypothetical protein